MSRPPFNPNMPVLNPEALQRAEEEEDVFDRWLAIAKANPDPTIDDPERQCPLFMPEVPDDPVAIERNPALAALQHIIHVDQTSQEIAEQFRDRGNEALKAATGAVGWKTARNLYTDGLRQPGVDAELRRVLFANRAQVELNLGNYGHCIKDCVQSLKVKPSVKAYFRCIKASMALEKWAMAIEMCAEAFKLVELTPKEAAIIEKYQQDAESRLTRQKVLEAERKRAEEERALPQERVLVAVRQRQYRTGPPEVSSEQMATYTGDKQLAYCEDNGELHFPVLFLYEEYGMSDFIKDVPEASSLRDQLEIMFPPVGERPAWDAKGSYTLPNLACFFHWDWRQKENREGYVEIDLRKPISEILQQSDVYIPVPMLILTFHVVPSDSSYAELWRRRCQ